MPILLFIFILYEIILYVILIWYWIVMHFYCSFSVLKKRFIIKKKKVGGCMIAQWQSTCFCWRPGPWYWVTPWTPHEMMMLSRVRCALKTEKGKRRPISFVYLFSFAFFGGSNLAVLRGYYWLCAQEWSPVMLERTNVLLDVVEASYLSPRGLGIWV